MKTELTCAIVQDLLPSYIDGLVSEETKEAVQLHLEDCENCRESCERMTSVSIQTSTPFEQAEVDYLRKTRKRIRFMIWAVLACAILVIGLFGMGWYLFHGQQCDVSQTICSIEVQGNNAYIAVAPKDKTRAVSKIVLEDSFGELKGTVYTVPAFFYRGGKTMQYFASRRIKQVSIGNRILWSDGEVISPEISDIYQMRMTAEPEDMLLLLGIEERAGNCRIRVNPNDAARLEIYPEKLRDDTEECLDRFAAMAILVDPRIQFVDLYFPDGNTYRQTVTADAVSDVLGIDIKTYVQTAGDLQRIYVLIMNSVVTTKSP